MQKVLRRAAALFRKIPSKTEGINHFYKGVLTPRTWLEVATPPKPTLKNTLVILELAGSARKTEFLTQSAPRLEIERVLVSPVSPPC